MKFYEMLQPIWIIILSMRIGDIVSTRYHWTPNYFQISDYPDIYRQCSVEDQKLLAIFTVDTGPYCRQQFRYRKRTAPVKLKVQLPLVDERLQLIVRIAIYSYYCFKILLKLLSKLFYIGFHETNLFFLRTPNNSSLCSRKMKPGSKDSKLYLIIWLHRNVLIGYLFTNYLFTSTGILWNITNASLIWWENSHDINYDIAIIFGLQFSCFFEIRIHDFNQYYFYAIIIKVIVYHYQSYSIMSSTNITYSI